MTVDKYAHTSKLFSSLSALKFLDIVKFKTVMIMYRAYYCQLPSNLQVLFKQSKFDNKYTTRFANKFKICYTRRTLKANCISILGSKLWNDLPVYLVNITNMHRFKYEYKKYIIGLY